MKTGMEFRAVTNQPCSPSNRSHAIDVVVLGVWQSKALARSDLWDLGQPDGATSAENEVIECSNHVSILTQTNRK